MSDHPAAHRRPRALSHWVAALAVAVVAVCAVLSLFVARRTSYAATPVRPATAVGDATCLSCHGDKASYEGTAHRRTSSLPSAATIAGSFHEGANVLRTPTPGIHYRMHADSTGFYQTAYAQLGADSSVRTERIAYVIGSGRKGQSYAYWADERLYQLPVSYWRSLDSWIVSPGVGYGEGLPNFDRAIPPRCLECHATWAESMPDLNVVNRYSRNSTMLGVTCERCHAAGAAHVARERNALHALRAPAIANSARLSRERRIEACAQCHGGLRQPLAPAFSYVAGQPLDAYFAKPSQSAAAQVDVHGNQVALLARSRCFQASPMTCESCHDVHRTERDPVALSGRCMTCHETRQCGLFRTRGHAIDGQCVDCHMPQQTSRTVVATFQGQPERVQVRTHWIRVYPETANR